MLSLVLAELDEAVEVAALVASLSERLARLLLDSRLALPDIEELRERALDVSDYIGPSLRVEHRVALGYFTDDDPRVVLSDVLHETVGLHGLRRRVFEAYGAHVVIVAVVDVGAVFRPQTILQLLERLILVSVMRDLCAVHLE